MAQAEETFSLKDDVTISGLVGGAKYNSFCGTIVSGLNERSRYGVKIAYGVSESMALRPQNLKIANDGDGLESLLRQIAHKSTLAKMSFNRTKSGILKLLVTAESNTDGNPFNSGLCCEYIVAAALRKMEETKVTTEQSKWDHKSVPMAQLKSFSKIESDFAVCYAHCRGMFVGYRMPEKIPNFDHSFAIIKFGSKFRLLQMVDCGVLSFQQCLDNKSWLNSDELDSLIESFRVVAFSNDSDRAECATELLFGGVELATGAGFDTSRFPSQAKLNITVCDNVPLNFFVESGDELLRKVYYRSKEQNEQKSQES